MTRHRARTPIIPAEHALLVAGGAPTDSIRRGIGNVFDKYDVETIAPGYGCVLRGRKWWRTITRCWTRFSKAWTRAWRCRATSFATRSAEPWSKRCGQQDAREIAPGVFWIGDCLAQRHKGKIYHGYNAAF